MGTGLIPSGFCTAGVSACFAPLFSADFVNRRDPDPSLFGHDKAISIILQFTPGKFIQWTPRKERDWDRSEFDSHADFAAAPSELERQEKLVIPKPAVRGLNDMLRRA